MPTTGADRFARKVAGFGPRYERNKIKALNQAALLVKTTILATAEAQGWPVKPYWVKYDIGVGPNGVRAIVRLRGRRAYLFERGARRHEIGVRGSKGHKAQRAIARRALERQGRGAEAARLHTKHALAGEGFGPVSGPVRHPGFKARGFFYKGGAAAAPGVYRILSRSLTQTLGETFGRIAS